MHAAWALAAIDASYALRRSKSRASRGFEALRGLYRLMEDVIIPKHREAQHHTRGGERHDELLRDPRSHLSHTVQ